MRHKIPRGSSLRWRVALEGAANLEKAEAHPHINTIVEGGAMWQISSQKWPLPGKLYLIHLFFFVYGIRTYKKYVCRTCGRTPRQLTTTVWDITFWRMELYEAIQNLLLLTHYAAKRIARFLVSFQIKIRDAI